MSLWRQLRYGWRGLRDRAGREQDVADEVAQYFEEAEAEWRARGLSPDEAKKAARREAGSMAVARERASEYGWENGVKVFMDDLRFAARQLRKHPAFTVTAVLTLALGIGANAAIFTVVERVLLAPLPYRNAERLAVLQTHWEEAGKTIPRVTGPDAADVREQARSLKAVSLYSGGSLGVQLKDHAAYTVVTLADANFARVFGLEPVAGRLYTDADGKHAALVSERFARDNFGKAQAAVGQVVRVEGEPLEIVGVLGAGFDFPERDAGVDGITTDAGVEVADSVQLPGGGAGTRRFELPECAGGAERDLGQIAGGVCEGESQQRDDGAAAEGGADGRFAGDTDVFVGGGRTDSADCVRERDAPGTGALDGAAEGAGDTEGAGVFALEGDAAGISGEHAGGADWRSGGSVAGVSDGAGAGGDGSEGAAADERDSFECMGAGVCAWIVGGDGGVVGDAAGDAGGEGRSGGGVEE